MKKIISLTLVCSFALLAFVGCQAVDDKLPANTTANTTAAITTQAPVTTAPPASTKPTFSVGYQSVQRPYSTQDEYVAWRDSLNLPATLTTDTVDYDYLCGYGDSNLENPELHFGMTLIISTPEELERFCYWDSSYVIFPEDVKEILEDVDLTQQSILVISGDWHCRIPIEFKTIVRHDDAFLVMLESSHGDEDGASQAFKPYSYVVAIDKADLPDGADTEIYTCLEFPNHSLYGEYPERVAYPDNRYIFVPIDEEE